MAFLTTVGAAPPGVEGSKVAREDDCSTHLPTWGLGERCDLGVATWRAEEGGEGESGLAFCWNGSFGCMGAEYASVDLACSARGASVCSRAPDIRTPFSSSGGQGTALTAMAASTRVSRFE